MWTKIVSFLFDEGNQRFLLFVGLVLALFLAFSQCNRKQHFKDEVTKQKNNIEALTDSISYYENKAGELTAEKLAFQTDIEQLETLNEDLHEELQKERDEVEQITKINAELRSDTTETDSTYQTRVGIDEWRFNWSIERKGEGWHKMLEGFTHFHIDSLGIPYNSRTILTKDFLMLQLVTGITEKDGKKRIFVRSTYPNLQVTNIQGAIIEDKIQLEKPSRFGFGPTLGMGYTPNGFKPFVGLSVNYNLIRF